MNQATECSKYFTQLMLSSVIQDFIQRYEKMPDKGLHVQSSLYKLGLKPGFAIAARLGLSLSINDKKSRIKEYVSEICNEIFFADPEQIDINDGNLLMPQQDNDNHKKGYGFELYTLNVRFTGTYGDFPYLLNYLKLKPGCCEEQRLWFDAYACFISGVLSGALSHLGYKVVSYISHREGILKYSFVLESMVGSWSLSASLVPILYPV